MKGRGQDDPAAAQQDGAIVVHHVVAHGIGDHGRWRPRFRFVAGKPHDGETIFSGILAQVEEGDSSVAEPQERDGHHVHFALVWNNHNFVVGPGETTVLGVASRQVGCCVVSRTAREVSVDEQDASVFELDEVSFAVARISRPGFQSQHDLFARKDRLADRVSPGVGLSGDEKEKEPEKNDLKTCEASHRLVPPVWFRPRTSR